MTPIPVGTWIAATLPARPGAGAVEFVGFTYVDQQAGLSARGGARSDPTLAESPGITLRLPLGDIALRALTEQEVAQLGLPARPTWLEFFGPQPAPGTPWGVWREHPALAGRFHPDYPDDTQVIVHDGGPRLTERRPELVWARVSGMEGDLFAATVLNQPHQLSTVAAGQQIRFVAPPGLDHGLMVTERYLSERPGWDIEPCSKCGLAELMDAPSDLIRVVFPSAAPDAELEAFSAFCGLCGGVQLVKRRRGAGN